MGRLEGKSVIITGAGSGIGRAASLLFTKEGARLIAVDRTEGVKETVELVRKAGGTAEAVMADAGSEKDVMAFIAKAVSAYGRLDAIWANAGVSGGLVPLPEQTVEHWQEILRINLIGPFLAVKYAMPHMIQQKYGSIVCTASVAGLKAGASDSFTFDTIAGSLDCLGTPSGTTGYAELMKNASEIVVDGDLHVMVASIDDLLRMKRAAGRAKDLLAVEILSALKEERETLKSRP